MSEEKEYEIEGQKHAGEGSTPFGFFEELFKSISQMCTRDSGEKRDLAKGVACEARPRMASTNLGDADGHREFAPTTGRLKGIKLVLPSESRKRAAASASPPSAVQSSSSSPNRGDHEDGLPTTGQFMVRTDSRKPGVSPRRESKESAEEDNEEFLTHSLRSRQSYTQTMKNKSYGASVVKAFSLRSPRPSHEVDRT